MGYAIVLYKKLINAISALKALVNWCKQNTFTYLRELIPVAGDCGCHRQFAAIGGQPEVLKAPPECLKPLLVWLIHLCDVETSAEHFVSRREHDGLE